MKMENKRKLAAKVATEYYEKKITFDEFLVAMPEDDNDEDISDLIDLIEHEPQQGGIFGVSKKHYDAHMVEIKKLIEKLSLS
jgi:hypothetical protein